MVVEKYPKPGVTTDIVIFTVKDNDVQVLLVKRGLAPFRGKWALPGGFVKMHESLEEAALRELKEETGVTASYLEQLYTFGDPKRDPRDRVISVVYMALLPYEKLELKAASDATEAQWFSVHGLPDLAFDHKDILSYALKRLKWKFEYTTVAFSLLPKKFTMAELKALYDLVFQKEFDKRNFYKKIVSLNILKEEGVNKDVGHRPPMMYSLKKNLGEIIEIV